MAPILDSLRNMIRTILREPTPTTRPPEWDSLDLPYLTNQLVNSASQIAQTRHATLLLLWPDQDVLRESRPSLDNGEGVELPLSSPIVRWLQDQDAPFARWEDLSVLPQFRNISPQDLAIFQRMDTRVLIPLRTLRSLTGILVMGARDTGESYTSAHLTRLSRLSDTIASTIEHARMYAAERAKVADLETVAAIKSEYIMAISHQLKTPISAVKASAEMLAQEAVPDQGQPPELHRRLVAAITRGVDTLDQLVTELTEYGKMQSATLELNTVEASLSSIASDTCELLQPLAHDKGIQLTVDTTPHLPRAIMDPHRVQQILVNLINNAIKFTQDGGRVGVRVTRDNDQLLAQVQDNGPGISAERQPWVFEAFYGAPEATPSGSGGSGLGLAIAKALTELHGGTIWVDSIEGEGSTFSFTIPLGQKRATERPLTAQRRAQ